MVPRKSFFRKYGNTLGPGVNERYLRYCEECREEGTVTAVDSPVRSAGSMLLSGVIPRERALGLSSQLSEKLKGTGVTTSGPADRPLMKQLQRPITELGREIIDFFCPGTGRRGNSSILWLSLSSRVAQLLPQFSGRKGEQFLALAFRQCAG